MSEIHLIAPLQGALTPPLQLCSWQEYRHEYEDGSPPSVNRGLGLGVHLVWEPVDSLTLANRRYDILLSTQAGLQDVRTWRGLAQNFLDLYDLELGRRYFWKVVEYRRGRVSAESELSWFETHPQPPRWLSAHGIANLRDVGGWAAGPGRRVRQGRLFRSVELNNHFHLSPAAKRYLLQDLGIRTDLDLRGPDEKPAPALDPRRVGYINTPVDAYAEIAAPMSRAGFGRAFQTLADPARYPVLAHCWGGADRTGTLVFLLNGLLGVSPADLYHDYEATSLSGVGRRLATSFEFQEMLKVLAGYAPEGASLVKQIEGYLSEIGVTSAQIAAIRANLLEDLDQTS
jgi:protein-tyrosine phosphatase